MGRTFFEWTDSARAERYSDDPEAKRALPVWVWYPAAPADDAQPGVYLPEPIGQILSQQFGVDINQVPSYAYDEAPLAASDSPFPVLVFSHGTATLLGTYSALLEELASHGYVVVGITHPYNALVTTFSDGRIIPASPEATANESVAYWVEDTAFVVDQVAALNEQDARFGGRLDLARLGILGHSFGGATAADFCLLDARCAAGLNLDGTLWGEAGTQGVARPFMQIFSDHTLFSCEDIVAAGGAPSVEACQELADAQAAGWQKVSESAPVSYDVTIAGTMHNSFADNYFLVSLLPFLNEGAPLDQARAWRITTDYALAFFDKFLNGADAPLLDAASADYPEVTIGRYEN